jgi:hypothetical protein
MKRYSDKTDLPPAYEDDMPQDSRRDARRTTNFKVELLIFQVEHLVFCIYFQNRYLWTSGAYGSNASPLWQTLMNRASTSSGIAILRAS